MAEEKGERRSKSENHPFSGQAHLFFCDQQAGLYGSGPIILLILPANCFDNGRSVCLSQLLLGMECPACGLTRGIMHLIHLDLENAFAYNMLSFIVLPLMIVIWIQWFFRELRIYRKLKTALHALPGDAQGW